MKQKLTLKQQVRLNRQGENAWARAFGKPVRYPDADIPAILKPKRVAAVVKKQSESEIQRDILSLLKRHPKVAIVERHNSGALPDKTGRLVRFNRVTINGVRALISDITCTLKNGKTMAIEVKEGGWSQPDFDALRKKDGLLSEREARELGQWDYLCAVRKTGGIGIFTTDVQQVIDVLEDV